MPLALITGASSGLGRELAHQLAARRADLVIVARSSQALDELAGELREVHGVAVEVIVADVLDPDGLARIEQRLAQREDPIDLLVNNAGFGLPLRFADNDVEEEVRHLRIHVEAPLRLMHAALGTMRGRGGRIINVASVAAFIPRSTYAACKRWLVGFSAWANAEYAPWRGQRHRAVPGLHAYELPRADGTCTGGRGHRDLDVAGCAHRGARRAA